MSKFVNRKVISSPSIFDYYLAWLRAYVDGEINPEIVSARIIGSYENIRLFLIQHEDGMETGERVEIDSERYKELEKYL